jgi:patatin-like phospholipase/acyl hydrolase
MTNFFWANVTLFADGGGVRGLSSLLILQELMRQINVCIGASRPSDNPHHDVKPHDIFELVAGTSTGGLIAVMLGKLGMSPEECIQAYHNLSTRIFSTKHFRARFTGGFAPSKYSGSNLEGCVRELLQRRGFGGDLPMAFVNGTDRIAW